MPLTLPVQLLNPTSVQPMQMGRTITSGESLSGITDFISTDGGGFWMLRYSGIQIFERDQLKAWRAWENHMGRGATDILVPFVETELAPELIAGGRPLLPSNLLPTTDDPYFPETIARASPHVIATVSGAPLRSMTVNIEVQQGAPLTGGDSVFAVNHPNKGRHCYRIERRLSENNFRIWPPLREAITGVTAADFDWPTCLMRLVPDPSQFADVEIGRYADVSLTFREVV